MKKRIGFFGGSFDPIHFGHLNLAVHLLEIEKLDEILFCPAYCSPFKVKTPPKASAEHRLRMLELVAADLPCCSISTIELEQKGPSYTVDTLRLLASDAIEYRLILSADAAQGFEKWKEPDEILKLAPPLIGARSAGVRWSGKFEKIFKNSVVATPLFDVSSTEVRERLANNLYCGHLVPQKALDYIIEKDLYCPNC